MSEIAGPPVPLPAIVPPAQAAPAQVAPPQAAPGRPDAGRPGLTENAADTVRGIGFVALSYFLLTIGDVSVKWALPAVGVAGAMFWRGVFGAGTVAAMATIRHRHGFWRMLRPRRWQLVLLRGLLHSLSSFSWYVAWQSMNLIDTYAIGYTAPLIMTLLAVPLLGERIRWRRALATLVGFAGVMVMLRPGGAMWTPAVPLLFGGIVMMTISRILARLLSTTETAECLAFWVMAVHIPAGLLMGFVFRWPPLVFPWPGLAVMGALLCLGLANGLGHFAMNRGYALAPVSAVAPYEYTTLVWGGVLGFVLFREVPALTTLAGAVIVIAAGLYNVYRERRLRATPRVAG